MDQLLQSGYLCHPQQLYTLLDTLAEYFRK